jgi:hypothetical protein
MTGPVGDLLDPVARGDLRGWPGLPGGLTLAELTSAYPADSDWAGSAQLGRRHRQASYRWVRFSGQQVLCRAWSDGEQVILLDLADPPVTAGPAELAGLVGEPGTALDTWQGTLPMPESELVFPCHGLAVFVNRDTGAAWHLALFSPTTLPGYEDDLRIDLRARRHQQRSG